MYTLWIERHENKHEITDETDQDYRHIKHARSAMARALLYARKRGCKLVHREGAYYDEPHYVVKRGSVEWYMGVISQRRSTK